MSLTINPLKHSALLPLKVFLIGIIVAIIMQYLLGVTVLINYVPISLGLLHQLGGLVNLTLLTLIISNNLRHKL